MSRYIDREDLLKNLKRFAPEHLTPLIISLIEKQPTADVVEVVRCKDCPWFIPYTNVVDFDGRCRICQIETDETEFCSIGCKTKGKSMQEVLNEIY